MIENLALATILTLAADPLPTPPHRHVSTSRAEVSRVTALAARPPARWSRFMACVEHRESNNIPTVVNSSGHAGLFQFSQDWRHGLPYMVAKRLQANGMNKGQATAIRRDLSAKPINHWSAQLQRVAFASVISTPGGSRHWALAGSSCEAYR